MFTNTEVTMVEKVQVRCSHCGAYFTGVRGESQCPNCSKK